ncbi:MAG: hypothetical protein GDA49_01615 [Rhodospirillales bacterium]|nr:hypothetical protein [Rhodospirillales bacterium]
MGTLFVSGVPYVIISVLPVRAWIINSIPKALKMATAAGIGLFLGVIAMKTPASWSGIRPRWSVSARHMTAGPERPPRKRVPGCCPVSLVGDPI